MSKSIIRRTNLGRTTYHTGGHGWTTDLKKAKRFPNSLADLRALGQRNGSVISERTAELDAAKYPEHKPRYDVLHDSRGSGA